MVEGIELEAAEVRVGRATGTAQDVVVRRVRAAVECALGDAPRVVLAVSGGRDSMVMLDAAVAACRERVVCVATFDHGTGRAAARAAALVERRARALGVPVRRATGAGLARREAAWRAARWSFLRSVAVAEGAVVATAHTRDDQVETVLIRALRHAGARGLAALYATGEVRRPLLAVSRRDVAAYAAARALEWVDDPSNTSRRYLRNRVRHDLLPALERARPGLSEELLELARRAAELRADVDRLLDRTVRTRVEKGVLTVDRNDLVGYDPRGLGLLWPALAARVGCALDRRGTERLAQFTIKGRRGGRIQLSGGYEAVRHRDTFLLRRAVLQPSPTESAPLDDGLALGAWCFRRMGPADGGGGEPLRGRAPYGPWMADLPADRALRVRSWRPGDRMTPLGASAPRRVKGLLRDAGIDAARRPGWPVVLAGEEIVWIPGVRRSDAATARSGRPVVRYLCERGD